MEHRNADRRMQEEISRIEPGSGLLLHVCCAPCASRAIERLGEHFALTLLYYNPNIHPKEEYDKRFAAFAPLTEGISTRYPLRIKEAPYDSERFFECAALFANEAEGGARCQACFALRLQYTAQIAKEGGFAHFASSLSVGPRKNAAQINAAGEKAGETHGAVYLPSDFKKQDGYKRSLVLSREFGLYRQNYCGCVYSLPKTDCK